MIHFPRSRSGWQLVRLVIASMSIMACSITLSRAEAAQAHSNLYFGEPLLKPSLHFQPGDFGPITAVNKIWDETFDGRSKFRYSFLSHFDYPPAVKEFPQSIGVYDGDKEIQVFDWNSADCSLQKVLLMKDAHDGIFLLVAKRTFPAHSHNILPQNYPAPQLIQLFRLIDDNEGEALGKPRAYFQKVAERKTVETACTAEEVYGLTRSEARLMNFN